MAEQRGRDVSPSLPFIVACTECRKCQGMAEKTDGGIPSADIFR